MSWPFMPILSSTRPREKPGARSAPGSARCRSAASSGLVFATVITTSACAPLVMNVFEPLMTYSSPSRMALVLTLCRSDPVPGSVIAMAPTASPLASFGSHSCFCSSVPYSRT